MMDTQTQRIGSFAKLYTWLVAFILLASGVFLAWGGFKLISHGGSWYYLIMGVALIIAAIALFLLKPLGAYLYALALIATAIWAFVEVGTDFWQLIPRLATFVGFGALVAFSYPNLAKASGKHCTCAKGSYVLGVLLFAAIGGVLFCAMDVHYGNFANTKPQVREVAENQRRTDWQQYGNMDEGTRFSGAEQITPENINKLQIAWQYQTGDVPQSTGAGAEDQNTPLFIEDTLYVCTPHNMVIAINGDTGKEIWKFDPKITTPNWQRCRGLAYYDGQTNSTLTSTSNLSSEVSTDNTTPASTNADALCARRIFMNTTDDRLFALDLKTGQLCEDFGSKGEVDLELNMGEIPPGWHGPTSAPTIAGEVVVIGGRVADNYATNEPGGVVRAYDVHTGKLTWAWDPGNDETTGNPPEGKTYTRGTVNVWAPMSYDPELDLVYAPTGNATPDFWAGERTELDDKYSSSVVALEAKTGKIRWIYQTVHHDLWDYDLPAQPLLYDIPDGQGGYLKALVQITKSGEIFLLDRENGTPLAEVVEKEVPQGNVEGERYSKTQPFSVGMPSIGNEKFVEKDMWGATPFDQLLCRIDFMSSDYEGLFTPPGMNKTLQFPGSLGGMNWGSASLDPTTSYMFVNDMRLGLTNWMIPRADIPKGASGIEMGVVPQEGTPFGAMRKRFLSPLGIPCQKPPFGTMSAIDLKTRKVVWTVPVGTVMDTGIMNIPMHAPFPIGMPTIGGSMATKSGLLFFAGTQDFYLRAYDSATGKEVWKERLPVGSQGTPITYVSPKTGKQYLVLTAGGARQSPVRGDYVIAWTLAE